MWTKNIDEHAFLSLQCKRTDVPKFLFALNDKKWMRLLFLGRNPCHTGNCERKKNIYGNTTHIHTLLLFEFELYLCSSFGQSARISELVLIWKFRANAITHIIHIYIAGWNSAKNVPHEKKHFVPLLMYEKHK